MMGNRSDVMMSLRAAALVIGLAAASAPANVFMNSDFDPGSWTAATPFLDNSPPGGLVYSVTTDRFIVAGPENIMIQQFDMNVPASEFVSIHAPVFFDGFVYDPSTDGAIINFGAAVRTLPATFGGTSGFGVMRLYLEQAGKLFILSASSPNFPTNYPKFVGHDVQDPELIRNASLIVASDLIEVIPDVGFDFNSHPDFAGGPISFGVGYSMTSTNLAGAGQVIIAAAWDDVSFRLSTVPEPASLALLSLGGLALIRRRVRRA